MFIHSSHIGHISCFHLWAVVKSAAMNSYIRIYKSPFSLFLSEIGGPSRNSMVNFLRNPQTFLQWLYYFTYLPAMYKGFISSYLCQRFCFFLK